MKRVLIVTHIPFWRRNSGDCSRVIALVGFLRQHTSLTIIYGGGYEQADLQLSADIRNGFELVLLGQPGFLSIPEYMVHFERYVSDWHFDVCIVEHVFLTFMTELLPPTVKLILDTNDIVSDRVASFRKMNMEPGPLDVSSEQELAYFRQYDSILAIQRKDFEKIASMGLGDRVVLAPHPIVSPQLALRPHARVIGFLGSTYYANVDALQWFLDTTWPALRETGVELHIYGRVHTLMNIADTRGISIRGFVEDLSSAYEAVDIVINPVRLGAGLKIKNLEALGYGLPLVTSGHGATGIDEEAGRSFLVADEPHEFLRHITRLITSYELRQQLGNNAWRFIRQEFSPEKCFGPLLQEIVHTKKFAT